jgi:hypothetical protein
MGFLFYAEKSNVTPPVMNNETKIKSIVWVNTVATIGVALAMVVVLFILLPKPDKAKIPDPQPSGSGITPRQLAQTVVAILAEIDTVLLDSAFLFSSAELTIAAKQTLSAKVGAGMDEKALSVKLKGEVAAESETSVEVSYKLEDQILAIIEVITLPELPKLDLTERKVKRPKPMTQTTPEKPNIYDKLQHAYRLKQRISKVNYPTNNEQLKRVIDSARTEAKKSLQDIRKKYLPSEGVKDAFVAAIIQAIEENKFIRKSFGKTCVTVEISFSIKKQIGTEAGIEFVGVGVSGSTSIAEEGTHTLKLSFGGC